MKWIVELKSSTNLEDAKVKIEQAGGSWNANLTDEAASEILIAVEAPYNFPDRIKYILSDVIEVYPNSDISLY